MMNKKQVAESQKECANMLGMALKEYKKYLKNVKVNENEKSQQDHVDYDILKFLGIKRSQLKTR